MIITKFRVRVTFKWRRELPWARGTRGSFEVPVTFYFLNCVVDTQMFNCYLFLSFLQTFFCMLYEPYETYVYKSNETNRKVLAHFKKK